MMLSTKKKWTTKTAAKLLSRTACGSIDQAVAQLVLSLRSSALQRGMSDGVLHAPYDPWPIAVALGAKEVREVELGFDGRIIREDGGLVIEIDCNIKSPARRRFTLAHEAGHLALWEISGKVVKTAGRKNVNRSEVEELCDAFAAELLAPLIEVKECAVATLGTRMSMPHLHESPPMGSTFRVLALLQSIVHVSNKFDISLQFAKRRIFEAAGVRRTRVALLDIQEGKFIWRDRGAFDEAALREIIREVRSKLSAHTYGSLDGTRDVLVFRDFIIKLVGKNNALIAAPG